MRAHGPSRREFLKGAAAAALVRPASSAAAAARSARASAFFAADERAALEALADGVLPGAAELGAVDAIEQLLTAFDVDPPRIHAGGPLTDDFPHFVPLNRVQERGWRIRLYGGEGVVGWRTLIGDAARGAAARLAAGGDAEDAWSELPDAFREVFTDLVIEGCLGDPVYGGNRGGEGWRRVHFEGPSLPRGYLRWDDAAGRYRERPDAPVTTLEPGPGPDPLSFPTKVMLWIASFLSRWGWLG